MPTRPRVRAVLEGFSAPRYAAGHPRGRYAYVSDDAAGQVVAVDVPRAQGGRARRGGEGRPPHLDLADGERVVVSLGAKAERLALVDVSQPARPRLVRTFPADDLAHDVGFTPDGLHVWISSGAERRVALHDAALAPARALARRATTRPST